MRFISVVCALPDGHKDTHAPVLCRGGRGPHIWIFRPLPLRGENISWLLGPEALQRSHDAFHLLILVGEFLPDLVTEHSVYIGLLASPA